MATLLKASCAVTVTSKATPAVVLVGAVSAMLAAAAALTVTVWKLVKAAAACTVSFTVTVCEPAMASFTPPVKVCVPSSLAWKVKSAGTAVKAPVSVEEKCTVPR